MSNAPKAQIVRGNQTICAFDSFGKRIELETPKSEKDDERQYQPKVIEPANDTMDIVGYCRNAVKNNAISYRTASSCIIGELRCIYFKTITKPIGGYDIEMLSYMDRILFNNLADIIEGVIHYGSKTIGIKLVKQVIINAIQALEVQVNIDDMLKVIDRVYEEF